MPVRSKAKLGRKEFNASRGYGDPLQPVGLAADP
jgi:hypothetical protein